jgi:hypothetical protein
MPGVVGADAGFQQMMRKPFLQGVDFEGLPAATGVARLAGADRALGLLLGVVGVLLAGEGARGSFLAADV